MDKIERYLKAIADELHHLNRTLDRMSQAPGFYNEKQLMEFQDRLTEHTLSMWNNPGEPAPSQE